MYLLDIITILLNTKFTFVLTFSPLILLSYITETPEHNSNLFFVERVSYFRLNTVRFHVVNLLLVSICDIMADTCLFYSNGEHLIVHIQCILYI